MVTFSYFLMTLLMFSGLFLIGLILLQRGRGGGLAGAFGGMGGQSAFGTKAGDVFTRITIGVASAWILLCAGSVVALHHSSGQRADQSLFRDEEVSSEGKKAEPKNEPATETPDVVAAPKDDKADANPPAADQTPKADVEKKSEAEKPVAIEQPTAEDAKKTEDPVPAKPEEPKAGDAAEADKKPADPKPDAPADKNPQ